MPTFMIYRKLGASPFALGGGEVDLNREIASRLGEHCPEVFWLATYDEPEHGYSVDIFEAPHAEAFSKVTYLLISEFGMHVKSHSGPPWDKFMELTG